MRVALLWLVLGCGRIGFDGEALRDGDIEGDGRDGPGSDAEPPPGRPYTRIKQSVAYPAARFGHSLAIAGDGQRLAVGARGDGTAGANTGAVIVFVWTGAQWNEEAVLTAANAETADQFGLSVAISGDGQWIVVGAPREDSASTDPANNAATNAGAVYVFQHTGTSWAQQAYLKAASPAADALFGEAVAIDAAGALIVAGMPGANDRGAVATFTRSGATWTPSALVTAASSNDGDDFGTAVALARDGGTLAVGATGEASSATGIDGDATDNSMTQAGAVYLFVRAAPWTPAAYVKASNTDSGDFFGYSVGLSDDGARLVVAAEGEDGAAMGVDGPQIEGAAEAGAVYLFERAPAWQQRAYLKASNTGIDDRLGRCVAIAGDGKTILAGAQLEDGGGAGIESPVDEAKAESGAAYVYRLSGGAWQPPIYVKATGDADPGDQLGRGCALDRTGLLGAIGATGEDRIELDSGAVYAGDLRPE